MSIRSIRFQFIVAMAAGALLAILSPAHAAEPAAKVLDEPAKTMASELKAMGLGMTPEKQKALDDMGKTMAKSLDTPEMRASMDKIAKDMSGTMAKQLPVMMQAMQPMMADMLPRMLRMQADMLQILFSGTTTEPKAK